MVMHARKLPRLNDGYYDRGHAHPFEDKSPPKSQMSHHYNERFGGCPLDSPGNIQQNLPSPNRPSPRYHKRNALNEKGLNSTPDKRVNNFACDPDSGYSGHDRNGKDVRSVKATKDQKEKDHRAEVQKSALRVSGDWSEHLSSSGKKYYYNCKTEISKWEKPKDWIELPDQKSQKEKDKQGKHSSSGASYDVYRHSSGEKQSSTKPASSAAVTRHGYDRAHTSQNSVSNSNPVPTSSTSDQQHRQFQSHHYSTSGSAEHRPNMVHQKAWPGHDYTHGDSSYNQSPPSAGGRDLDGYGNSGPEWAARREGSLTPSTPGKSRYGNTPTGAGRSFGDYPTEHYIDYYNGARHDGEEFGQTEDMDISPGSTPTEESMLERQHACGNASSLVSMVAGTAPVVTSASTRLLGAVASLPNLISHTGDQAAPRLASQQITQQAIQTLQKLQQALIVQQQQRIAQQIQHTLQQQIQQKQQQAQPPQSISQPQHSQQTTFGNTDYFASPSSPAESDGTPLGSPEYNNAEVTTRIPVEEKGRESPKSEYSFKSSRRGSPTPSLGSSQNMPVGTSHLAAAHRKQDSVHLTPSLSNYYNNTLIGHVTGWPTEQIEHEANKLTEDAHTFGSLQCTQVSVDLKKARSLVRLTEIKSTLNEQRLMFFRQQVKDLENIRGQNTYLSTRDT